MTRQKTVIDLSRNSRKIRSKALGVAVGVSGVDSVALTGESQSQLEVTGEAVDATELILSLKKKLGAGICGFPIRNKWVQADLISFGPVESKKPESKPNPTGITSGDVGLNIYHMPPSYVYTEIPEPVCSCSIM